MISYRFKRRAFLTAVGGGVGLKIMLRNTELAAQNMRSPARLLVTHWPVGIVSGTNNALWNPTSGSVGGSLGLKPFADAGLGADMTVFRGVSTQMYSLNGGGSHEQGTVSLVTGRVAPGTRASCCEGDDAYAGGPSFEQILLNAAGTNLRSPMTAKGFANAIADSRTDFAENSTQCLSYTSNMVMARNYQNASVAMAEAALPLLSPLNLYNEIFSGFIGGTTGAAGTNGAAGTMGAAGRGGTTGAGGRGGTTGAAGRGGTTGAAGTGGPNVDLALLKALACKKSVLDFALEELNQLRGMVPSQARNNLMIHTTAVMNAENTLRYQIENNFPPATGVGGNMGMAGSSAAGGRGGAGGSTGGSTGRGGTTGSAGTNGAAGTSGGGVVCQRCGSKPAGPAAGDQGVADPNQCPPPPATKPANCCDLLNPVPANCRGTGNDYNGTDAMTGASDDAAIHQRAGAAHLEVLKAAFICDMIRVGTFQWSPGTNHVAFRLYPGNTSLYMHHPQSHKIGSGETTTGSTPDALNPTAQFLYNVQLWYFQRHAENFATWKTAVDGCGNSLLDFTAVPFVTEVRDTGHPRSDMAAMIIGGKQLGFTHNIYRNSGTVSINQFWGTVAQAFNYNMLTTAPFAAPISGLWNRPPGT